MITYDQVVEGFLRQALVENSELITNLIERCSDLQKQKEGWIRDLLTASNQAQRIQRELDDLRTAANSVVDTWSAGGEDADMEECIAKLTHELDHPGGNS